MMVRLLRSADEDREDGDLQRLLGTAQLRGYMCSGLVILPPPPSPPPPISPPLSPTPGDGEMVRISWSKPRGLGQTGYR